ncbi:MAG: monovalent cation/H+ antiporter complex subunit F [Naasia sp.]
MSPISIVHAVVGILLAVAALLVMYRIVRGPTILDRMIASDVMLTTVILVLATEMALNQHTRTLPIVLVLAGTAVFGSIAVARYVSKQDKTGLPPAEATELGTVPGSDDAAQ